MLPEHDRSRPGERAASNVINGDTENSATNRPQDRLTNLERAVLRDVMLIGDRDFWLRRAKDFDRAKPVVGDPSAHSPEALARLREAWLRCDQVARACRARAEVGIADSELDALFEEVA